MSDESRIQTMNTEELDQPTPLYLDESTAQTIMSSVGTAPAETGGALGGARYSSFVQRFWLDESAAMTPTTYYPDVDRMNAMLRQRWNPEGTYFMGVVHSHPRGVVHPSTNDLEYGERILRAMPAMGRMLLPIVESSADGGAARIHPWAIERVGSRFELVRPELVVKNLDQLEAIEELPEFERVRDAYHLPTLQRTRVVIVGCGGAAHWVVDLVRAGVGEVVIIDPDVVEARNVGTQHVSMKDVGLPKVIALARRLVEVSPIVQVTAVQASDHQLSDEAFARLLRAPLGGRMPEQTMLFAFTDSFHAQARIARLGLHLGVPTLSATVYEHGLGVEVAFAAHGVTRACIRCALASRYRAQLSREIAAVASSGTPLWATQRLNALKTPITMALLHEGVPAGSAEHPAALRWARVRAAITNRNLVLSSLDPLIGELLSMPQFDAAANPQLGALPLEATLWRQPSPDHPSTGAPACADCGGTGQLDDRRGRIRDTRVIPLAFGDDDIAAPEAAAAVTSDVRPRTTLSRRLRGLSWRRRTRPHR